jgi:23S rRNA pseudouridine2605 synthase
MERLNKVLAHAGVASRRNADELIAGGRISVNGEIVTDMGRQVDLLVDEICMDGERVVPKHIKYHYVVLNKPLDVITTVSDPQGRPTVMQLLPKDLKVSPVGRLDAGSEGLLLLTNDGDLAHTLTHPRHMIDKEYRVKVSGTPTDEALAAWRNGMYLEDGKTLPAGIRIESSTGSGTWLRFVISEGRNRQIRRMIEAFHFTVHRLIRVRVGQVTLGDLEKGSWRNLSDLEVASLQGNPEAIEALRASRLPNADKPKRRGGWAKAKPKPVRPGHKAKTKVGLRRRSSGGKRGR